jgi:N-acetylglutamate synthase-like GNAT family acetyltransferase
MGAAWQIRGATREDADGLEKCMQSAYAPYRERMGGVRLPPMDVDYTSEIENYPTWVVESEGDILAGMIMIFEKEHASIANVAVNPRFQGQGIGGELMKFAESKAKERNFTELYLTTHKLLKENLSLYRHLGWKEICRDNTKVFMKKKI